MKGGPVKGDQEGGPVMRGPERGPVKVMVGTVKWGSVPGDQSVKVGALMGKSEGGGGGSSEREHVKGTSESVIRKGVTSEGGP